MNLKPYIREVTPPIVWKAARKAIRSIPSKGAQSTRWTFGVEQPVEFYDERYERRADLHRHYTESDYYPIWVVIAERIHRYAANSILDIGCGAGQLACLLRDQGVSRYVGLDFSPARIARARETCPEYEFSIDDVHETSLIEKREYDTAVSVEFLEHINDDLGILKRIPQGTRVLASVPNYPATGHVRYFETADDVRRRYRHILDEMCIDTFSVNPAGKVIYIMDGVAADGVNAVVHGATATYSRTRN